MAVVVVAGLLLAFLAGLWMLMRRRKFPSAQAPTDAGQAWRKIEHLRHDGIWRDEDTHQFMLRTNSVYRDAADGRAPWRSAPDDAALRRSPLDSDWEFQITYQDREGDVTIRRIRNISFNGESDPIITAYCERAGAERNFRASRVLACINLRSGRAIKDFGVYLKRL